MFVLEYVGNLALFTRPINELISPMVDKLTDDVFSDNSSHPVLVRKKT
jgi:hypothetical protein